MNGYTVSNSIDLINEYCNNPEAYPKWQLQQAINDARVHYDFGIASKDWYDYVVQRLSQYL